MRKNFRKICLLAPWAFGLLICHFGGKIEALKGTEGQFLSEHPGYYDQWLREKAPANGAFPHWMHNAWAKWDRSRLRNRAAEDIIEAVYELGPKDIGGRTRSIWIDPRNENIILAAAISGGMWRSENGGQSWRALNDHEASLMASCITSDPANPDVVYYGTGEGRANSADVDGNGIYKSIDGGKTFQVLASTVGVSGFETIWDLKHSLDLPNTLFAGTHSQGLWRSTDAGQQWEQVFAGGNKQVNNILVLPGNRVMISMQSNQVYASDSGGKAGTFAPITFPAFPGSGQYRRIQMANCDKYPEVVYAIVEAFDFRDSALAFYKSRNGGRNWQKMPRPSGVGASYQGYCLLLGVHPTDSTRVVAAGVKIGQTDDGGQTWFAKKTGHADHHGYSFYPTSKGDYLVGTDGGLYRYSWDEVEVKANLNNGYNVTQFYAGSYGPKGAISISGAQDNGTQVATGPLTTKKFFGADGAYAHIGLQDGTVAYFSSQDTGIRRISNFNPGIVPKNSEIKKILDHRFRSDGVDFINAYGMNPADQNQLYYRTNRFLYRTKDRGDSWEILTNVHSGLKAIAISNEADPVVYTGGSAAQLYKIENAASAAKGMEVVLNQTVPATITNDFLNAITINPKDKYSIYLAFSNYSTQPRVWKVSGLSGSSPVYTNISGDLPPGLPVNHIATDPQQPDKNLFAGTDFGLYYSTDSGKTWQKELRIPNVAVHEVKMRADGILFLYTHGRGMWAAQLKGANSLLHSGPSIKIYPNPTSDKLQISISKVPVWAAYTIYDSRGRKVAHEKFNSYQRTADLSALRDGYYFVRVETDTESTTEKILVR
jgi:hypothetical protein